MLASSAVDMQLGVDGHKPSDGKPYMSCTPVLLHCQEFSEDFGTFAS